MGDFLRLIVEWIQYLWPFRKVQPHERALYTIFERWQWDIGPGIYLMIPYFFDVKSEPVVEALVQTPRIDITLSDGKHLSAQATGTVQVTDLFLALNKVDSYMESSQELLHAIVAEKLAEVDAVRLTSEKRGRLLSDLRRWVNEKAAHYGVEFTELRFTTFVFSPRTYRVISDSPALPW
jgi:regulator of protease activity HflC (stomatin/prohibitin superfamily)